jgi:3,4-dihydroxy 2-butanone 4-phosphate synthase/GTP cyclohydrolase II
MKLNRIEDALAAIAAGSLVVVVDDEHRENEGDLIAAAQLITAERIAFMVRWTSGVLCVALPDDRLGLLNLPPMVAHNTDSMRTAFSVSTDFRHGTTTGISAEDRAATVRALVDPAAHAGDFLRPGHIFPLRARPGGVLKRPGHTEAAVDLTRMAGLAPGGVLAEIVNADGSMSRLPQLKAFAAQHGLPIVSIHDLIAYRKRSERIVQRKTGARLPTHYGQFQIHGFQEIHSGQEHVALTMGDVSGHDPVLVRVHSECMTGEVFGSMRCDCRQQLEDAMAKIAAEGRGVIVYLRGHEGRGIGLLHKLRAYALQDAGRDTIQANEDLGLPVDSRDYSVGAQMLRDLGVSRMRLMTNNPLKYHDILDYGLEITQRVPLLSPPNRENARYLNTKQTLMGHLLELDAQPAPTEPAATSEAGLPG